MYNTTSWLEIDVQRPLIKSPVLLILLFQKWWVNRTSNLSPSKSTPFNSSAALKEETNQMLNTLQRNTHKKGKIDIPLHVFRTGVVGILKNRHLWFKDLILKINIAICTRLVWQYCVNPNVMFSTATESLICRNGSRLGPKGDFCSIACLRFLPSIIFSLFTCLTPEKQALRKLFLIFYTG